MPRVLASAGRAATDRPPAGGRRAVVVVRPVVVRPVAGRPEVARRGVLRVLPAAAGRGVPRALAAAVSAGRAGVRRVARAPAVVRRLEAWRAAGARGGLRVRPTIVGRRTARAVPAVGRDRAVEAPGRGRVAAGRATRVLDGARVVLGAVAAPRATEPATRAGVARGSRPARPAAAAIGRRVLAVPSRREVVRWVAWLVGGRSSAQGRRIDRTEAGRRTVRRARARVGRARGESPVRAVTAVAEATAAVARCGALVGRVGAPRSRPGPAAGTGRDVTMICRRGRVRATRARMRGPVAIAVTALGRTSVVRAASWAGGRAPAGTPRVIEAHVPAEAPRAAGRVATSVVVRSVVPRRAVTSGAATSVVVRSVVPRRAATSVVRRPVAVRGPRGRGVTAPRRAPGATARDRPTVARASGATAGARAAVSALPAARRRPERAAARPRGAPGVGRRSGPSGRRVPTGRSTRSSRTTWSSASWTARSAAGCAR